MDRTLESFKDVLEPRREESSNFMWISRELNTVLAYNQRRKPNPTWHKQEVIKSAKIQETIQKESICQQQDVRKDEVVKQLWLILNEIGYNKRLPVIRWLGLLLTKICLKVCTGIHVYEDSITRVKRIMGNTPVIFLPSHRSYADFILMSYVCFTYDIEIPAIAAGMDFHSMWGMGTVLRDTGAFFMRRSFNDDSLYWNTFRQYIHQLITRGDLPIEFFIEGTRSRSGKSLTPKFGLLSMVLKTFFTAEVPDILFVPISISYDRVLEEKLFAFELLGVPKPKESTSGFFKSLSIIKERYGNIYVDFAEPISARDFFSNHIDRSIHSMKPIHMQEFTQKEKEFTSLLAYNIVHTQQKSCVITTFNLVALSLTNSFMSGKRRPKVDDVIKDAVWLNTVLRALGAVTDLKDPVQDVWAALAIHKGLVWVDDGLTVDLVKNSVAVGNVDASRLKGHALSQETMSFVVPFVMLQIYVNPLLHWFLNLAFLTVILKYHGGISKDLLFGHFCFLRTLFSHEFATNSKWNEREFEDSVQYLHNHKLVQLAHDKYISGDNSKLEQVLCNILDPFLFTYYTVAKVLIDNTKPCDEKSIVIAAQAKLESLISTSTRFIHPYCLNLDTLSICLSSFTMVSALQRRKVNGIVLCQVDLNVLIPIVEKLETYVGSNSTNHGLESINSKICLESKL